MLLACRLPPLARFRYCFGSWTRRYGCGNVKMLRCLLSLPRYFCYTVRPVLTGCSWDYSKPFAVLADLFASFNFFLGFLVLDLGGFVFRQPIHHRHLFVLRPILGNVVSARICFLGVRTTFLALAGFGSLEITSQPKYSSPP